MFLNWAIEARKWQLALRHVTYISFTCAYKATFSGTTLAFFTPNRTGEYLGRMVHLEEDKRVASIPLTIVCSIAQLLITLGAGCIGLIYLKRLPELFTGHSKVIFWINVLFFTTMAVLIVLTLFYFRVSRSVNWLVRIIKAGKLKRHLEVLDQVNATILLRILSLSGIRFFIFILQYYLLFRVFGVDVEWWQAFWSISVVFLVIAMVPSLGMLTELGIRWQASIQLLQLFSTNVAGIFATSLAVWMINLVIPAFAGSLLLMGLKIFRNGTKEKIINKMV